MLSVIRIIPVLLVSCLFHALDELTSLCMPVKVNKCVLLEEVVVDDEKAPQVKGSKLFKLFYMHAHNEYKEITAFIFAWIR